jgi:hypothetical protein
MKDDMYTRTMGNIEYWEGIFKILAKALPHQSLILLEG